MADFNKTLLIGRLTVDPELRYTAGGQGVSDLRLATSRKYKTKEGEQREDRLYVDVTVWGPQAENCCQYLRKGSQVHVEGRLKMDEWQDKATGEKRSKIKVEADFVQFLDPRPQASEGQQDQDHGYPQASPQHAPPGRSQRPAY